MIAMLKLVVGAVVWPAWWVGAGRTESRQLLRMLAACCAPIAAGSAMSPLTGGWALPTALAAVFVMVVMPILASSGSTESTGPR